MIAAGAATTRSLALAALASLLMLELGFETGAPPSRQWSELDEYIAFVDAATQTELALLDESYRAQSDRIWELRILVRDTHERRAEQELRRLIELREPLQHYLYPHGSCGRWYHRTWRSVRCKSNPLAKECM